MTQFQKYVGEQVPFTVDYTAALPAGETLQAASTVTARLKGTDYLAAYLVDMVTLNSTSMQARIKGGEAGKVYIVSFVAITQNYTLIEEIELTVR